MKIGGNAVRVICVDDSRLTLEQLKRSVREIVPAARIDICQSPNAALQLAKEKGCDVLLTEFDIQGRFATGYYLAKKVQEINPRLNIVFLTECSADDVFGWFFDIRASGYIKKPCEPQALLNEFQDLRYPVDVNVSRLEESANTRIHAASEAKTWWKKLLPSYKNVSK